MVVVVQSVLISCGNLSFLNWLTALPAVWCLDDHFLSHAMGPFKPSAFTLFRAVRASHSTTPLPLVLAYHPARPLSLTPAPPPSSALLACRCCLSACQALDRAHPVDSVCPWWRWLLARDVGLLAALAWLSWPVVRNLLSPNQVRHTLTNVASFLG